MQKFIRIRCANSARLSFVDFDLPQLSTNYSVGARTVSRMFAYYVMRLSSGKSLPLAGCMRFIRSYINAAVLLHRKMFVCFMNRVCGWSKFM